MENYFEIGIITKAQGIRGELRVFPTTDNPVRFEQLAGKEVILKNPKTAMAETMNLTAARLQKNMIIVKLRGINDRNTAEKYINFIITIPPELSVPLEADEYFVRDLIGLEVVTEGGEKIGIIENILHTGANDVYEVRRDGEKPLLLPAIKDVVKKVSIKDGFISVQMPEGLEELYA